MSPACARGAAAALAVALVAGPVAGASADGPGRDRLPREGPLVYRPLPELAVRDIAGRERPLSAHWAERPLLLTMVFSRCVRICPPYLESLKRAVASVGGAGEDFDILVMSLDPRDGVEEMSALAARHRLAGAPGWSFAVAAAADVARLRRATGFWVEPVGGAEVLDHPALLAAVDRGTVVRLLVGSPVERRRLREVVWELGRALVPAYPLPGEEVRFRCLTYDPFAGGVQLDWGMLVLLAPALVMFGGAGWIFSAGSGRRSSC